MFFSNLVMYFIILTTAATLHAHGITQIATAQPGRARRSKPLAGKGAYWLFTLGLIGTGMLGVPVLAGSSAYAICGGDGVGRVARPAARGSRRSSTACSRSRWCSGWRSISPASTR